MSVNTKGMDEVLRNLENKLGQSRVARVVNKTLRENGEKLEVELKDAVLKYKDTGATVDEVVRSNVSNKNGVKVVKVGWNGPKKRYKLVHLNEFGYTRFGKRYSPRGLGIIRKTIEKAEKSYIADTKNGLEELAK